MSSLLERLLSVNVLILFRYSLHLLLWSITVFLSWSTVILVGRLAVILTGLTGLRRDVTNSVITTNSRSRDFVVTALREEVVTADEIV